MATSPVNGPYFWCVKDWLLLVSVLGLQLLRYPWDICSTGDGEYSGMPPCSWSVQGSLAAFLSLLEWVGETDTARSVACGWAGASD